MKLKQRLISILFYVGLIPFFPFLLFKKNRSKNLSGEYVTALAVSFVQIITGVITLLIWIFGYKAVVTFSPYSIIKYRLGNFFILDYLFFVIFGIGIIVWFVYVIRIISGLNIRIPFITKISQNMKVMKITYVMNLSLVIFLLVIVFLTIYANKISMNPVKPAKVYMLYDDMGFAPHWIFPLGFYQVQRAAIEKWGNGYVSIEPVSKESIKEALENAEMVFLSIHGADGVFWFANKIRSEFYTYGPKQIQEIGKGQNLKFVYLANCYGGMLRTEWEQVFHPAKIKAFDYTSLYPDHLYWLWIKLPGILKNQI